MKDNSNTLREKVAELYNMGKFEDVITSLTDEVLETEKDTELYVLRGNTWIEKEEYDKAITDYNKAIEINPKDAELYLWRGNTLYIKKDFDGAIADYTKVIRISSNSEIAFYNRGLAWFAKKEYDKAIGDYTKIIKFDSKYADTYYNERGNAWKAKKEYNKAIDDYNQAIEINPAFENAYYNRGLARIEINIDPEGSRQDFEKYLKLATVENENSTKYARYYIKKLDKKNDKELSAISDLISKIKEILLLDEEFITHYTSLSALKSLILDFSKFRISEGNFMNDTSEGEQFFDFLKYEPYTSRKVGSSIKTFSPKPFIGSFVTEDKHNDLTLWRFYGKEKGEEAKGCSITLRMQKFIENIKNFLSNENIKEARLDDESDLNFYQVAYLTHGATNFYIPSSDEKSRELTDLMTDLREKVRYYEAENKTSLEEELNSIAFLFKSGEYKNENEVRLVVKGIEFEKGYNMDISSPRVYIELVSIKDIVSQITFGPKVDKVSEWRSAFHYRYKKDAPEIEISQLRYK